MQHKFSTPTLEKRLDVTLYRLGVFHSIFYSCQAILHNKIIVNGKFINNGNSMLRKGDFVELYLVNQRLNYTGSRFHTFRYGSQKESNSRLRNNDNDNDLRGYLLLHSGDEQQ